MNEQVSLEYPPIGKIYTVLFKNIKEIHSDATGLIQVLRSANDLKNLKLDLNDKDLEISDLRNKINQVEATS